MVPSPKRILYVESNVDRTVGGSYYSLLYLTAGIDRARFEPIVVFATDNPLIARFSQNGVRTVIRPAPNPTILGTGEFGKLVSKAVNLVRGLVIEPVKIAAWLRSERIALVHLNNGVVRNDIWMVSAMLARLPCITHERGIVPSVQRRVHLLATSLRAVICISQAVRNNLISLGLEKLPLIVISNGLDPAEMRVTRTTQEIRAELRIPPSSRVIGIVGIIKQWKGHEVVIRAMANLRDRFPDLVCLLIGDTAPADVAWRRQLAELISRLGLDGRVIITGYRTDVANYINLLEIQIHASTSPEPFGRVLLEGMALSKAIIASSGGATPEIIVHDETGILFEPGSHESLATALSHLLADRDRAEKMGAAGLRRLIERFSISDCVSATEELYERILAR
jgi:glycosyltransferase involved in cell wall biosynthesis